MKVIGFIVLGMAIVYTLLLRGEFGIVLLGGAIFGLLTSYNSLLPSAIKKGYKRQEYLSYR